MAVIHRIIIIEYRWDVFSTKYIGHYGKLSQMKLVKKIKLNLNIKSLVTLGAVWLLKLIL
jgi:hypothetical protein